MSFQSQRSTLSSRCRASQILSVPLLMHSRKSSLLCVDSSTKQNLRGVRAAPPPELCRTTKHRPQNMYNRCMTQTTSENINLYVLLYLCTFFFALARWTVICVTSLCTSCCFFGASNRLYAQWGWSGHATKTCGHGGHGSLKVIALEFCPKYEARDHCGTC